VRYLIAVTVFLALLVAAVFPRSAVQHVSADPNEPGPSMDRAYLSQEVSRDLDRPHPSVAVLAVKLAKPAPKPKPKPKPVVKKTYVSHTSAPTPKRSSSVNWVAVAKCESGDHWNHHSATAGLYWGGLQMTLGFWRTYGGLAYASRPDLATEAQQIAVADRAYRSRGLEPWPVCGKFG